ncbi:nucleotide exchange factor GrpE [Iningainema tapete]|uniref:Nucleotide exchange factor GrpE n=1 Tax=Iningainema tapete BLCC-T55 TaxID=2748662 RepID=A0A8J6XG13_9CYAN|nr:nucleotide exchange factor GrpE [Iningainema tapete]MBD2770944.1 nucleotide exchange factor GrpE [Iningainema tapete BLCC-T55]
MSTKKTSDKTLKSLDEALRQSINETLQTFINENLKKSIESSITETLENYINNTINIDDPKQIIRVYYKNTAAIQENSTIIQQLYEKFEQTIEKTLIEQRQKNGENQRKIQNWEQSAIDYFQILERAIENETTENKKTIEKLLSEYEQTVKNQGLEPIKPKHNEPPNEKIHQITSEQQSEITPGNIIKCTNWGYRIGERIIQKAKVIIATPPTQN